MNTVTVSYNTSRTFH